MSIEKRCAECGQPFLAKAHYYYLCWDCWEGNEYNRMNKPQLVEEVSRLAKELTRLRNGHAPAALDQTLLRRLIQLCHPDKHGNSPLANEVTQRLLEMRR
ncbi:MAG TPA: hypothetical protein VF077_08965 [Nitrospiraceae bacterium]